MAFELCKPRYHNLEPGTEVQVIFGKEGVLFCPVCGYSTPLYGREPLLVRWMGHVTLGGETLGWGVILNRPLSCDSCGHSTNHYSVPCEGDSFVSAEAFVRKEEYAEHTRNMGIHG